MKKIIFFIYPFLKFLTNKKIYAISLFLLQISCNDKDKLPIFLTLYGYQNQQVYIELNDSVIYNKPIYEDMTYKIFLPLTKIDKSEETVKFYVRINNDDTTFLYNLSGIDTLLIAHSEAKVPFHIWNQEQLRKLDPGED